MGGWGGGVEGGSANQRAANGEAVYRKWTTKPFVFGFYKRKFCRGLPGRSDEANNHTEACMKTQEVQQGTQVHMNEAPQLTFQGLITGQASGSKPQHGAGAARTCTHAAHLNLFFKQLPYCCVNIFDKIKWPTWQPVEGPGLQGMIHKAWTN